MAKKKEAISTNIPPTLPPVVAVLGHVDHGKTTLLDAIRKTSIAAREHGSITQKIGASSISLIHEGKKRTITFIDTPGHETFSLMRSRGATASDIGLLVVSSTEGIKPQTIESIEVLRAAHIPFIVVFTKSDLPERIVEKVKQQLIKEGVMLEGLGGDVPVVEVSAKTGKNIQELLELILLVQEVSPTEKHIAADAALSATVIEAKKDPKAGVKVSAVIKNGTLRLRDEIFADNVKGRIRTIMDATGTMLKEASIGQAVELLGFEDMPTVGATIKRQNEADAYIAEKKQIQPAGEFHAEEAQTRLRLILCTDTFGSLEAIVHSLPQDIIYLLQKTGEVTTADILLAKSTGAIVIGFNAKVHDDIVHLAKTEKVLLKNYQLIYELIDEITEVVKGKALAVEEEILGIAKVLASFPYEKTKVIGLVVTDGRIAKGDKVRIERGEAIVGEGVVQSVRQGKNPISKVEKGTEAGIVVMPLLDFTIGDMVVSHG